MDVQFGSMSPVVTTKPQGAWCKFKCAVFGHKHDKHGCGSRATSDTSSLSSRGSSSLDSVNFGNTPPLGRRDQLYTSRSTAPHFGGYDRHARVRATSEPVLYRAREQSLDASATLAAQKRYSDPLPVPTKASAASNYGDAVRSFDYARIHARGDSDRIEYFQRGVDYAKRAAALGYREAAKLLQKQYKDTLRSSDGSRELVNDHNGTTFWNGVVKELSKGISLQEQSQMMFNGGGASLNNRIAAAKMINLSSAMHADHRQEYDLSHVTELTGQLDVIIAGGKSVPSNLVSGFVNKR